MDSKEQTTIIIVRHTDYHNPEHILAGRLPRFRLSDLGRQQAERTAQVLALTGQPVVAFYSSPQLRARQTAHVLAQDYQDARVRITQLLNEVRTGWQGKSLSKLLKINFDFYSKPCSPNDEKMKEIRDRMYRFVRIVRRRHAGKTIVAVTHGDPAGWTRAGYLRRPLRSSSLMRYAKAYPGLGSLIRLTFSLNLKEKYPISVEYYDPNGAHPRWSQGWVKLKPKGTKI